MININHLFPYFFLLFLLFIACEQEAQQTAISAEKVYDIDTELSQCMDANPSTTGMLNCVSDAYKKWDIELNRNYKLLRQILGEEDKEMLMASQKAWIAYRDTEFRTIHAVFGNKDGTMYIPMAAHSRVEIVKKRALELADYYEILTEH